MISSGVRSYKNIDDSLFSILIYFNVMCFFFEIFQISRVRIQSIGQVRRMYTMCKRSAVRRYFNKTKIRKIILYSRLLVKRKTINEDVTTAVIFLNIFSKSTEVYF